jgi:hypothetical protein
MPHLARHREVRHPYAAPLISPELVSAGHGSRSYFRICLAMTTRWIWLVPS